MNTLYRLFINQVVIITGIVVVTYLVGFALYLYLPKEKTIIKTQTQIPLEYIRFDIKRSFQEDQKVVNKIQKQAKKREYKLLSNIILVAIYDLGNKQGAVTIKEKGKSESLILSNGESFKSYKLHEVYKDYVLFKKGNKEYRVVLDLEAIPKFSVEISKQEDQEIIEDKDNDKFKIKRDYLNSYVNNFDRIWKDISITENRVQNKINGFKINRIKKGSAFERLGLKKGDLIQKVNNIKLNSYNDAFRIYNKMDQTKLLHITILRNNQEMEINYEIE